MYKEGPGLKLGTKPSDRKVQRELTHQHPHSWFPARHLGVSVSLLCDWAICQREDSSVSICANCLDEVDPCSQPNFQSPGTSYFSQSHRVARNFPKLVSPLLSLQLPAKRQKHKELLEMRLLTLHFPFL